MSKKITTQEFKEKVFNYDESKNWKFNGDMPTIIDFYADWCAPCKIVSPILDEIQKENEGKLNVYKINVDEEPELAGIFNIKSIPSFLFIPDNKEPQMAVGALSKETFQNAVKDVLKI